MVAKKSIICKVECRNIDTYLDVDCQVDAHLKAPRTKQQ